MKTTQQPHIVKSSRRSFLKNSAGVVGLVAMGRFSGMAHAQDTAPAPRHRLPPLPYGSLEPVISNQTLEIHFGKHHQGYADNLNRLVTNTEFEQLDLEQIVLRTAGRPDQSAIFNNAAQVWNHTFYWGSLRPDGDGAPPEALKTAIESSFGSFEACQTELAQAAITQFASGWAWLVADQNKLKVVKTPNAETPLSDGMTPLLTIDVWEHAYYLDYQNRRAEYVQALIDKLLNWDFAAANFQRSIAE